MRELILPEYGRNIQNMVEIAMKIEDRNERNRCARSIINCMGNLFPYLRDNEAFQHKLLIITNFSINLYFVQIKFNFVHLNHNDYVLYLKYNIMHTEDLL